MRRIFMVALGLALIAGGITWAGPRRAAPRASVGFSTGVPFDRRIYHPIIPYYLPYPPPVLVISPYGPAYYVPPAVVVTQPFFCVFHNDGFVSRVGLLDHLAGMHKIPIDAAATICPDGVDSCVFPSY